MSLLEDNSPKHCAKKGFHFNFFLNKRFLYWSSTSFSSLLFLIFILWLILHPAKPEFYLKDTEVYQLNLSPRQIINSTIQATLLTKNPNTRVGVYYDQIRAYAVYKGQQITADSPLPEFYQGHQDENLLYTSLQGIDVPVATSVGYEVSRAQIAGKLFLVLEIDGQLRWKVGSWVSGRYRFDVKCFAIAAFPPARDFSSGVVLGSVQGTQCATSV